MSVVISYSYADNKCIVVWVVETSGIFFQEFDDGVIDSWHLWHGTYQLDVMDQPQVSLIGLFG